MNTYVLSVCIEVEVDAFNEADAREAAEQVFGEGTAAGLDVTDFRVVECAER